jgi:hypothetical protein
MRNKRARAKKVGGKRFCRLPPVLSVGFFVLVIAEE